MQFTKDFARGAAHVVALLVIALAVACGGEAKVVVPQPTPASISIASVPTSLGVGTSFTLTAIVIGADGKQLSAPAVTWSSSDRSVATVQSDGTLSAVAPGTVTITAAASAAPSVSTNFTLTVVAAIPTTFVKLVGDSLYSLMDIQVSGFFVEQSVRVLSAANTPLPNVKVTFGLDQLSGTLSNALADVIVTTDANGVATLPAGVWSSAFVPNSQSRLRYAAAGLPTAGVFTHFRVGNSRGLTNCELSSAGLAYCTGLNANGAIGDGTTTDRANFVAVSGNVLFASLADGVSNHHCALTAAGQAYCWGQNSMGELGDGTLTDRTVPTPVTGGLVFNRLHTYLSTTCGITTTGATYCWGYTGTGGWGGGDLQRAKRFPTPTLVVTGGLTFRKLAMMDDGLCGITQSGVVACLARGYVGPNADGTSTQRTSFVSWPGTWKDLAAGNLNVCALDAAGLASCVGSDQGGALGAALGGQPIYYLSLTRVAGGLSFNSIHIGNLRGCGVTATGDVHCWGFQPGNGMPTSDKPVRVPGLTATSLRIGSFRNACAKVASGQLYCWGMNTAATTGTVGDGTRVDRYSPTAAIGWPDGPVAGTPVSVALNTPATVSLAASSSVPQLPSVVVKDRFGTPLPGVTVTFAPVGGGSVSGGIKTTDANGIATVGGWTLPSSAGAASLEISIAGAPPAVVQATVVAP